MLKLTLKKDLYFHKIGNIAIVQDECHICKNYLPHFHIKKGEKESRHYDSCDFYSKYLFDIEKIPLRQAVPL